MIITDDRTEMDECIEDPGCTVLLLVGDEDSAAGALHESIDDGDWEEWHFCFLITDPAILTPDEWDYWFDQEDADRYAVLGGPDHDVVEWGSAEDLVTEDGECDYNRVARLFAMGDAGREE